MWAIARDLLVNMAASVVGELSSPSGMMSYLVIIGFIIYGVVGWHRRRVAGSKRCMDSWYFIATSVFVAVVALTAAGYGVGLRSASVKAAAEQPKIVAPHIDPGSVDETKAVLVANRYYSAKNKEDVAGRLDTISSEINSRGEEILRNAEIAINHSRWEAADQDMGPEIDRMNKIIGLFGEMKSTFYDHRIDQERDYRIEMNAILFPQEQFLQFKAGAEQFRDGLVVWAQMRNSDTRESVLKLVHGARMSFGAARQNFVSWLSRRQELVEQTRMALKQ